MGDKETASEYVSNVFLNFPFDDEYRELRNALLFAVFDCGFSPRCALEEDDCGTVRFEKILRLIEESKYSIHDISRTEPDPSLMLPRFNMPLELGVFLGARKYGNESNQSKKCLILDKERYRYQKFISDIAGNDIKSHESNTEKLVSVVCGWLRDNSRKKTIPGGRAVLGRYSVFCSELPEMCSSADLSVDELSYNDYAEFISEWLRENARQ